MVSKTEKDSLETHVDLCAERYARLEEKYEELKETFKEDITYDYVSILLSPTALF